MVVLFCLLIEIELEWLMISSKVITPGVVQPEYWNIPPNDWGAILRTNVPQGLSGASRVCQYHLFLSLFASLPRIMLILGGPDGISDSVRETMRKVLDAWLNHELARQPCLKIDSIFWRCVQDLCTFVWLLLVQCVWKAAWDASGFCFSTWLPVKRHTAYSARW